MSRQVRFQQFVGHPAFFARDSVYIRWYPKSLSPPPAVGLAGEPLRPRGAYIHIPFCDVLCRFCPFNKRQSEPELISRFVNALLGEIRLYGQRTEGPGLDYVYFGGGTPSVLSAAAVERILVALRDEIGLTSGAEITLESHPTHIDLDFVRDRRALGITRFSTGLQAFDAPTLEGLGAHHGTEDVARIFKVANVIGQPIAIDLLFRCEGQTLDNWRSQLRRATQEEVAHVSCYSLILKSDNRQPSLELEARMTLVIEEMLAPAGLSHYASCASGGFDYAREGFECRYETGHWAAPQDEFIGLGPGALGFLGTRTTVNGLDVPAYIKRIDAGLLPLVSATQANVEELRRRFFVLGVKALVVPLDRYRELFAEEAEQRFSDEFSQLTRLGFAQIDRDQLTLTPLGRLFVDSISEIFFSPVERDVPHPEEPEIRRVEVYGKAREMAAFQ